MTNKTKEQIRMELYKEVYIKCLESYHGGYTPKQYAEMAVADFDEKFKNSNL